MLHLIAQVLSFLHSRDQRFPVHGQACVRGEAPGEAAVKEIPARRPRRVKAGHGLIGAEAGKTLFRQGFKKA